MTAELFDDGALLAHFTPVMFGSRAQIAGGIARALAGPRDAGPLPRAVDVVSRLPRAVRGHRRHLTALCEVAQMLSDRLGMPPSVSGLFGQLTERWDGRGEPVGLRGEAIPLALRVIHVARDAAFQRSTRRSAVCWRTRRAKSSRSTTTGRYGMRPWRPSPILG